MPRCIRDEVLKGLVAWGKGENDDSPEIGVEDTIDMARELLSARKKLRKLGVSPTVRKGKKERRSHGPQETA